MPKVSQEYRDARRAQILEAARRCFLRNGFHETSMQDLFTEAGLSSGAVYLYFAGKDDVILAIAEENMREVLATVHGLATSRGQESLGAAISAVLDVIGKKHAADQLGAIAVLVWSEVLRNPALAKRFGASLHQMRTDLAELIREHRAGATTPPDVTPEALAALFMTVIPGYILQLSLFGPRAVTGVRDAVQAIWTE
jgi:AcrR family transcriptional regulator